MGGDWEWPRWGRIAFAPVTGIGLIHIVVGFILLAEPDTAKVSGLAGFAWMKPYYAGALLIAVGVWAICARVFTLPEWARLLLVIPQQLVLFMQLAGIALALKLGQYPDGYRPDPNWAAAFGFIMADQIAWIFLCMSHLLDMVVAPLINHYLMKRNREYKDAMDTIAWYRENWVHRPALKQELSSAAASDTPEQPQYPNTIPMIGDH